MLGQIEEYFLEQLTQGDTFRFAGRVLRFEGIRENEAFASPADTENASIPSFEGGKFPLTTYLASQVRAILADPARWAALPEQVREWLGYQKERSVLPGPVRPSGRDLSASRQVLYGGLPVRGAARAPDARHASDAAAGARRRAPARLRRDRLFARGLGAARPRRALRRAAGRRSRRSSTRTCSATTSKRGWRNPTS